MQTENNSYKYLKFETLDIMSRNNIERKKRLIEAIIDYTPADIKLLENEMQKQNWDGIYSIIHKLKPNFALLGNEEINDLIKIIENDYKNHVYQNKPNINKVEKFLDLANEIMDELQRYYDQEFQDS